MIPIYFPKIIEPPPTKNLPQFVPVERDPKKNIHVLHTRSYETLRPDKTKDISNKIDGMTNNKTKTTKNSVHNFIKTLTQKCDHVLYRWQTVNMKSSELTVFKEQFEWNSLLLYLA